MSAVKPDVEVFQNLWELEQMLAVVERLQPSRVLEIGSWHGGTLWHWLQVADTVVAVDDEMRREDEWRQWAADAGTELHLLRGFSQEPEIVKQARALAPYDLVFIDGDHRYESVRADWENFSPLVAPGGVIAFHDTQHPENTLTYGVGQLWEEVTQIEDRCWVHIANTGHCGIGLLWM